MVSDRELVIQRLRTGSVFRLVAAGTFCSIVPFFTLMGVLALFGMDSLKWNNVPVIAFGTEYKWLNPRWLPHWEVAVRSGYTYTDDPVPDRTFNPATISLPAHTLSLGTGFLCKGAGRFLGVIPCSGESALWPKGIGLDLAYQEWFYESRAVIGNLNPTVDGAYDAFVRLGALSLRALF